MKKINPVYLISAIAFLILVPVLLNKMQAVEEFYGIAENPIRNINLDYPVEVVRLYKFQGDAINIGDTILVLRRLDLKQKEMELKYEILEAQQNMTQEILQINNEISQLQIVRKSFQDEYQIRNSILIQRENQLKNMNDIISGSSSIKTFESIELEKKDLHQKYMNDVSEVNLKIQNKEKTKEYQTKNFELKIEKLNTLLAELMTSRNELIVTSPENGMIGQMECHEGDRISAFNTILKIHGEHPSNVIIYIGDRQLTLMHPGDSVNITSLSNPEYHISGIITSLGTRVTSLPDRLKKVPDARVWGREVQIAISSENEFLQGEKVKVILL